MEVKICAHCGEMFVPKNHSQKYCSCSCNTRSQRIKQEKKLVNKKNIDEWDKRLERWENFPDISKVLERYFEELFRVSKNQIIWGGNYFPFIWNYGGRCFIYWHKGNPVENFADGELAWTSFDKNAKQFDYRYYGNLEGKTSTSTKFHPTQKPIMLYKWLLTEYAKQGDLILDTHVGSASSLIACEDLGFDYVAFELDKDYYDSACKRIENYRKQLKLDL